MKKILVVDDQLYIRDEIREILEKRNYKVIEASDGIEAVEKYREESPDAVSMDINMPKLNGVKATQMIVNYDKNAKILVCSTMMMLESYRRLVMEAGAKSCISKPFSEEEYIEKIEEII